MKKKTILIILFYSFLFNQVKSQNIVNTAFRGNEVLKFVASYNMSGLWTDLAQITMSVKAVRMNEKNLYKLVSTAQTYTKWDSYFKIRDSYQSWVNPKTIKPYIFKRDVNEGGFIIKVKYIFKRKSLVAKSTMQVNKNAAKTSVVKINANTLDLVSAIYYFRNIDFSQTPVNTVKTLTVLIDNKLTKIQLKYRGKEKIKVSGYGTKECYKIGISLKDQNIVKNNPTNNIWLTADKNKVPVLIKAVIPVGSIQIRLSQMTGLRNK